MVELSKTKWGMVLKNWCRILFIIFLYSTIGAAQVEAPRCINPIFQEEVESYLDGTVKIITVAEAEESKASYIFLDAREKEEFQTSHIEGSIHIGYDHVDFSKVETLPKDSPIIIYCSIGYRSEKIGEKLLALGFTNVYNLYGSIFEWVNQHYPIYNTEGEKVNTIHTYNKRWSKWISNDAIQKVW